VRCPTANAWVEPEIADELPLRREAADVADRGDDHVDAGDRHQPLDLR